MYHLRFTPIDLSGYTFDFLKNYKSFAVAYEDKKKNGKSTAPHYHIVIDTDYGEKSVRDAIKAALKIPSAGKGRNNAYYMLNNDWNDVSYIFKYGNIKYSKGFSEAQIMDLIEEGRKKYICIESDPTPDEKIPKIPFQQAVITQAAAEWYKYKRRCKDSDEKPSELEVLEFVTQAMRDNGKGINVYLVKECALAVLYDDFDYRNLVLKKIKSTFLL